ncbi:MAG: hypothetical protein MZV70_00685 [Desulfobacterales bacterium]|nr:hypothetical protein [Desulfobacterales bacterium]
MEQLLSPVLTDSRKKKLRDDGELDFSYLIEGLARFRGNIFYQLGNMGAVFRLIPIKIETLEDLGLPDVLRDIIMREQEPRPHYGTDGKRQVDDPCSPRRLRQ